MKKYALKHLHPGFGLSLWMRSRHKTQGEVAQALGVSRLTINQLINQKRSLTAPMALKLQKLTKVGAFTWMVAQIKYDLHKARKK